MRVHRPRTIVILLRHKLPLLHDHVVHVLHVLHHHHLLLLEHHLLLHLLLHLHLHIERIKTHTQTSQHLYIIHRHGAHWKSARLHLLASHLNSLCHRSALCRALKILIQLLLGGLLNLLRILLLLLSS